MSKKELKELLNKLGDIIGEEDFDLTNDLVEKLENNLPFKSKKEKENWLDVLMSFKFWEDFEELTLEIIERGVDKALTRQKRSQKYITFNSIQIAWNGCENEREKDTLRKVFDIYRIATKDTNKNKVSDETFQLAANLYKEYRKFNRQNDTLLVLDNDYYTYQSARTKNLHKKNEEQEKKLKKLAHKMGFKIVYYSHLATLQSLKSGRDLSLNRVF